jgi:hypothetical protein
MKRRAITASNTDLIHHVRGLELNNDELLKNCPSAGDWNDASDEDRWWHECARQTFQIKSPEKTPPLSDYGLNWLLVWDKIQPEPFRRRPSLWHAMQHWSAEGIQ